MPAAGFVHLPAGVSTHPPEPGAGDVDVKTPAEGLRPPLRWLLRPARWRRPLRRARRPGLRLGSQVIRHQLRPTARPAGPVRLLLPRRPAATRQEIDPGLRPAGLPALLLEHPSRRRLQRLRRQHPVQNPTTRTPRPGESRPTSRRLKYCIISGRLRLLREGLGRGVDHDRHGQFCGPRPHAR